jgi:hypothetical protein
LPKSRSAKEQSRPSGAAKLMIPLGTDSDKL